MADITPADVEAIRAARRAALAAPTKGVRRAGAKAGEVGINRLLARLRHVFVWAIGQWLVDTTPFKRHDVTTIKLDQRAETARQRRLGPGEETALLDHADPHLRALIVAALFTGCRLGELLSLQWGQIRTDEHGTARAIHLTAQQTKTNKARAIPVGPRLRAELAMRRHAPDGTAHPDTAYIFGNDVGEPVASIRTAWEKTCAAAGITGLHFHDLRRESGSRLLEAGVPLHVVRDWLGHENITTTSTYLASTLQHLASALDRLDPEPADPNLSHTVRTNEAEDTNGWENVPAVTH
jgi:integrase